MILKAYRVLVMLFCVAWLTKQVILPSYGYLAYKNSFMELSSKCGTAMDESWFISKSGQQEIVKSAEVHLMICHEYDKVRKTMLSLGVSENILAFLGLEALEIHQRTVSEIADPHRFTER
ncbi:MAG: TIGR03982 family His-Xaa-Ser system protein [Oceanospirillaceae bacterium]|nr:TIGR03982 family His-Xaa-Ser system protein [Oceanospirillaceae bacterium]|tara:strand:+ start:6706 stop:7065 length:360 start_codon:yes stop_codon:yes gene_type:complete